jgi:hypothetical protein
MALKMMLSSVQHFLQISLTKLQSISVSKTQENDLTNAYQWISLDL